MCSWSCRATNLEPQPDRKDLRVHPFFQRVWRSPCRNNAWAQCPAHWNPLVRGVLSCVASKSWISWKLEKKHPRSKQRSQHRFRFSLVHSRPVSKRLKTIQNPATWFYWNSNKTFIPQECPRSCPHRLLSKLFVRVPRHLPSHFAGHNMHFLNMLPVFYEPLKIIDHQSFIPCFI